MRESGRNNKWKMFAEDELLIEEQKAQLRRAEPLLFIMAHGSS